MAGITSGLMNLLGINGNAGTGELESAIAALQAVGVPTAEQLKLPELEKYVSAGVLTPEQYQAILADPETYTNTIAATQDNTGSDAQKAALQQLGSIVQSGGSSAINDANLKNNLNQTNQAMQAARAGITNDAQQRGVSGGGLEFIAKLMNEQSNAENANLSATNAAADNARLALQALTQQGQLGGQMQGQANQSSQAQAEAARQIAEYNSILQNQANQYNTQQANQAQQMNLANAQNISDQNTGLSNDRTRYNALIPQQLFQDEMQKASGISGAYGDLGKLKQGQAQQQNAFTGNLIGAGATLLGGPLAGAATKAAQKTGYQYGPPEGTDTDQYKPYGYAQGGMVEDMCHGGTCYAQGGEVHDHRLCMKAGGPVPGDDSQMSPMRDDESQDVVPANLSPNEIVLPRSVSMAPDAPQKAQQFVSQVKGQEAPMQFGATAGSFAEILQKLEENGLELRLGVK